MIDEKMQSIFAGAIYASVIGLIVFLYDYIYIPYLIIVLIFGFFSAFFLVFPNTSFKPRKFPSTISYFFTGALIMGIALIIVKEITENRIVSSILSAFLGVLFFFGTYFILNSTLKDSYL